MKQICKKKTTYEYSFTGTGTCTCMCIPISNLLELICNHGDHANAFSEKDSKSENFIAERNLEISKTTTGNLQAY